jgi:hypothetical protein
MVAASAPSARLVFYHVRMFRAARLAARWDHFFAAFEDVMPSGFFRFDDVLELKDLHGSPSSPDDISGRYET